MNSIEQTIFDIAEALETPVLILAILALAAVVVELGSFLVELYRRRGRQRLDLSGATERARQALVSGDRGQADAILAVNVSRNRAMTKTIGTIVGTAGSPHADDEMAKALADFDYGSMAKLERTRLLVRAGPALGLMGTLIPLSPALTGLADGDVEALSENLRIAFSVTVLGLLVGAIAFGVSLVRDRLYGQDLSELEYIAAAVEQELMG